jgi:hypothetical protein
LSVKLITPKPSIKKRKKKMQHVQNIPSKFETYTVTAATPVYVDVQGYPYPLTVTAIPGGGGTVLVEFTTTPKGAGLAGAAVWHEWPAGAVAASDTDALLSPVAGLRFTATVATATVEISA